VEAMTGLALALHALGDHRRAAASLREAQRVAEDAGLASLGALLHMIEVEEGARARLETAEGLSDYSLNVTDKRTEDDNTLTVCEELRREAGAFVASPLVARSLEALRVLLSGEVTGAAGRAAIAAEHRRLFHGALAQSNLRVQIAKVRMLSRTTALIHGIWSMTGHAVQQARYLPVRTGLSLFVARRANGVWVIVCAHVADVPALEP